MLRTRSFRLVVIAAIGTAALAAAKPPVSFAAPLLQPLADVPTRVAAADLTGNGKTDLVCTSPEGSLFILLGNGDGTFRHGAEYDIGSEPYSVAVADFNGDGKPDLAVGFSYGGIWILLGNGDGTFQPPIEYSIGEYVFSVAVADFNGDGKLDLAVATQEPASLSILLGNGDATFQPPVSIAVGSQPSFVAIGDFNGDGKPDVALTDYVGEVWILLGRGDGTFQPAVGYPTGLYPLQVVVADFNGDGKQDLAVSYLASGGVVEGISVLLGNGDGTFQPQVFYAAVGTGGFLAVADFDGDGNPDLAVAGAEVFIMPGNGDGTFQPAVAYAGAQVYGSLAVGDFNGDGNPDLAVACGGRNEHSGSVAIMLGNGHGGVAGTAALPVGYNGHAVTPHQVAVGDFNGDGKPDLAVADGNGTVQILPGNGDGTFQGAVNYAVAGIAEFVLAGDFNGGGISDLAVMSKPFLLPQTLSILLGNQDGTLQPGATYTLPFTAVWLVAGDFNGDGKLDLVLSVGGASTTGMYLMLGNGDGTFQAPVDIGPSVAGQCVTGDFNGDGKLDLAVEDFSQIYILLGNGDGTFQPAILAATLDASEGSIAVGDFNGDGIPDLAVAIDTSSNKFGHVSILLGNGDGTFRPGGSSQTLVGELLSVAVGDFNGDGKLDVAVTGSLQGAVTIVLGNGNGDLKLPIFFGAGVDPIQVAVSDFNGDSKPDLAVLDTHGPIQVLLDTTPAP
jgi:hypothetical protein